LPNTEIELLLYLWGAALAGHTSLNKSKRASGKTQSFNYASMSIRDVGPGRYSGGGLGWSEKATVFQPQLPTSKVE